MTKRRSTNQTHKTLKGRAPNHLKTPGHAYEQDATSEHCLFLSNHLVTNIEYLAPEQLRGYRRNARTHPKRQLRKLERSIEEFGFVSPMLIDADGTVIAGHARLVAAKKLGLEEVPVIRVSHLTPEQVKALRIADNRLTELAEWDEETLALELQHLIDIDFDVELTGFETPEIDLIIDHQIAQISSGPEDLVPELEPLRPPVSELGDLWRLDEHSLCCGDARFQESYLAALSSGSADAVITDPPYNVPIQGHVGGSGSIKHPEFVMASGEMSFADYGRFLSEVISQLVRYSNNGSIHYLFMNWRHLALLEAVCGFRYGTHLNTCVWVKSNGGMGSFYRSQHELILVFRNGDAPHINNIQLGKYGRNRTNVWHYEGVNTVNPSARADLELHPTVKPVALVADAIRDCTRRGDIVLDPFIGSGTTIIAAEQTGRVCAGIELDPRYVDTAIRRWQQFTGGTAIHAATGQSFDQVEAFRTGTFRLLSPPPPFPVEGE